MRAALPLIAILVAVAAAGCGGSSGGQTTSVGGQTITVPEDVHGVYGELEAILDQFPYQHWYTRCVVARVRKELDPAEAAALPGLSGSEGESKAVQIIAKAGPACAKATGRPIVDPNASGEKIAVLRADYLPSMVSLAKSQGLDTAQVECVREAFENLPDNQVVAMANGSHKEREGILLSVFKPCAKAK
ncbi:MAG: hypothetical protein JSU06_12125 [Actinobacteria bacterium]|nr:hypothetical protein [Actinomycetota bacterium]